VNKDNETTGSVTEAKTAATEPKPTAIEPRPAALEPKVRQLYLPKIVMCLLADLDSRAELDQMLTDARVEYNFEERDTRMESAFLNVESCSRPSLKNNDLQLIADHSLVLYIASSGYPRESAFRASAWFLLFGCKLLEAGAIAMKCESSGIAHSRARWLSIADVCRRNFSKYPNQNFDNAVAGLYNGLFEAFVQYPIASKKDYWSCGMHLLGHPDVIISIDLVNKSLAQSDSPLTDIAYLFSAFCFYILGGSAEIHFESGGTFHADSEFPSFRVIWEPCDGYAPDDIHFNPYGRWRFASVSE
jgi:hypothetical protein